MRNQGPSRPIYAGTPNPQSLLPNSLQCLRRKTNRIRDHPSFLSRPVTTFIVVVGLVSAVLYGFHTIFTDIVRME